MQAAFDRVLQISQPDSLSRDGTIRRSDGDIAAEANCRGYQMPPPPLPRLMSAEKRVTLVSGRVLIVFSHCCEVF